MKENAFMLAKERSQRYPAQTITDVNHANDIVLQAAGGIGLYVYADKTECMSFNQRGDISTLNGGPLNLVDQFTYLGCWVSSSENDINM